MLPISAPLQVCEANGVRLGFDRVRLRLTAPSPYGVDDVEAPLAGLFRLRPQHPSWINELTHAFSFVILLILIQDL